MFCWMYSGAKIGTTYMKVPVFQNVQNVMLFFIPWNQYFFLNSIRKTKKNTELILQAVIWFDPSLKN